MASNILEFDFQHFDEKGLKKVLKAFEKKGLTVASVQADNKPKRQSGVQTKKAVLNFMDGQALALMATAQGSIYQVKLNARVLPVKAVDNLSKAVDEIATKVAANSKKFTKTKNSRIARAAASIDVPAVTKTYSNKAQLESAQSRSEKARASLDELLERKAELDKTLEKLTRDLGSTEEQIQTEKSTEAALRAEIEQLQQEITE